MKLPGIFLTGVVSTILGLAPTPVTAILDNVCEIKNLDFSTLRGWSMPDPKWDGNGVNTEMRKSPDGNTVVGKLFYGSVPSEVVGSYKVAYGNGKTRIEYCLSVNLTLQIGGSSFQVSGRGSREASRRQKFFWLD